MLAAGRLAVASGVVYAADLQGTVHAIDLKTGKLRWSRQVTPKDTYVIGCGANATTRDNCPEETGPDFDFGNSPILRTMPNGRSVIAIGQKSGVAWGLDPDREGRILWQRSHRVCALGPRRGRSERAAERLVEPHQTVSLG